MNKPLTIQGKVYFIIFFPTFVMIDHVAQLSSTRKEMGSQQFMTITLPSEAERPL